MVAVALVIFTQRSGLLYIDCSFTPSHESCGCGMRKRIQDCIVAMRAISIYKVHQILVMMILVDSIHSYSVLFTGVLVD